MKWYTYITMSISIILLIGFAVLATGARYAGWTNPPTDEQYWFIVVCGIIGLPLCVGCLVLARDFK